MGRKELVKDLKGSGQCPELFGTIETLATRWLDPVVERLERDGAVGRFPKVFNDPVWGTIELMPWEVLLLDSPLVQRLRGVRQLGLAHLVYPGACHDRLEHARGVVEAADRMVSRLERNAHHRKRFGEAPDQAVPPVEDLDRYVVRLAALLHDLGHGPFSHAIEPILEQRYAGEFRRLSSVLRDTFDGAGSVSVSEGIAVLLVLTDAMDRVINHESFTFPVEKKDLALRLAARIVGARSHLKATYLSGVVSGPIDADKLDYMQRDSHHAGLPIGLDTDRLISKLEVITVTPENAPTAIPELKARAEESRGRRIYEMGISLSGIGAYEQMIVGRVLLYDRLYYHQKVRIADAMAQRLVLLAEEERGSRFSLEELFLGVSDDTMIWLLGGRFSADEVQGGGDRAKWLADCIANRHLYHRALAFAARFVAGLDHLDPGPKDSERAALWRQVTKELSSFEDIRAFERVLFETAREIGEEIPEMSDLAATLQPEHIIVDLPLNKTKPSGNLLLTRTENDQVGLPNLFFDPERWSNAYDQQKRCGYVFCPKPYLSLVSLAARIALFRRFRVAMSENADRFAKTAGLVGAELYDRLAVKAVIDAECHAVLRTERVVLSRIDAAELRFPHEWVMEKTDLQTQIAKEILISRPGGFISNVKERLIATMESLALFVATTVQGGEYRAEEKLKETSQLQADLRKFLRARKHKVAEGTEYSGGETDLIVDDLILIENKVAGVTDEPMEIGADYPFQARRYAIALCQTVFFTMVAYRPKTESGQLPQSDSVRVIKVPDVKEDCLEIRLCVPYGQPRPSEAKAPSTDKARASKAAGVGKAPRKQA